MELFQAILQRRSVRTYKEEPLTEEQIKKLIEAARWAPSGANFQPWKFIVVQEETIRKEIGKYARFYFIKSHHVSEAPVVIVCLADTRKSSFALIDVAMAAQNIMLQATNLGLGSCFIGAFNEEKIKEILKVPAEFKVVGLITVGKPAEQPSTPPRLDFQEITFFDQFGERTFAQRLAEYRKSGPLTVLRKVIKMIFRL